MGVENIDDENELGYDDGLQYKTSESALTYDIDLFEFIKSKKSSKKKKKLVCLNIFTFFCKKTSIALFLTSCPVKLQGLLFCYILIRYFWLHGWLVTSA